MRRHAVYAMICLAACALPAAAWAQAPGGLDDGRKAYEAGLYDKARDLLVSASKVAPNNAEVFLHLGKAYYQLGQLPEAIAAWQKTLQLAPGEPYATRMLQTLRGQAADVDVRLAVAEAATKEELFAWAAKAVDDVLADRSLTDAQRGKALVLRAELLLATGRFQDVPPAVVELQTRYPKAADATRLAVFMGRSKLRLGGAGVAEGLALLRDVAVKAKDTPEGAWGQYELLRFDIAQQPSAQLAGELAAWVKAHAAHPAGREALQALVDSYFALTGQAGPPARSAALAETDTAAIAAFGELRARQPVEAERLKLLQEVEKHLAGYYDAAGAFAAAIQAGEALLKVQPPLSRAEQAVVLQRIIDRQLAVSAAAGPAARDAKLTAAELAAIQRAGELLPLLATEAEAAGLADRLLKHLEARYRPTGAFAAAAQAAEAIRQLPLPQAPRLAAAKATAAYRIELVLRDLTDQAAAGNLPAPMPQSLRDVLALYAGMEKEFPGQSTAAEQVALAQRLAALAGRLPDAVKVTDLRPPDAWAAEIALGVVKATAPYSDPAAAVAVLDEVRKRYQALPPPDGFRIAVALDGRLLDALPADHARRVAVQLAQVALLEPWAAWQFQENLRSGRFAENAKLGEPQKQMIALLAELARRDAKAHAAAAVARLTAHLRPWEDRGQYAVVEEALGALTAALPEAQKREALLAAAELWFRQAVAGHQRVMAAGLKVPEKLDPTLVKALQRCCELQDDLPESDPFLARVRVVWQGVVNHYEVLGYHAASSEAIQVKAGKPAPAAERHAELAAAHHRYAEAHRELGRLLLQYDAKTKLAMTPAFQSALEAYRAFIAKYPTGPLADEAVARIFGVAQTFETQEAYTTAAAVYDEFAKFAAKIERLSQALPGQASTADRAALAAAGALDAHARKLLKEALAQRKDATPPAAILPEFTTALAAYTAFVKARPDSSLVGDAIRRIMAVALEYARVDAWDVAGSIFADLQKAQLRLEAPERIELCRGLCEMGKVMPDHARQVLGALVEGHGKKAAPDVSGLAMGMGGRKAEEEGGKGRSGGAAAGPGREPAETPAAPATMTPPPAKPADDPSASLTSAGGTLALGVVTELRDGKHDEADMLAMAAIRETQSRRAREVAMLREKLTYDAPAARPGTQPAVQQAQEAQPQAVPPAPILSEAELARQAKAIETAYAIFQALRKDYAQRPAAEQARGEVLLMVEHWRTISQWKRAASLAGQYLQDNPADRQLPQLRLGIARDTLAWASQPAKEAGTRQEKLTEVIRRFDEARAELGRIVKDFAQDRSLAQQAQWDTATSFLTQARVVDAFSPTLARGQYVRAAKELQAIAEAHHDHPRIAEVPQMLWNIAEELARRGYHDEALIVWNDLTIHYLTHGLAQQAAMRIAQTYDANLGRPLRAAEAYLEINFARGGDVAVQNAIYAIGQRLRNDKRWVEALHVLETFVDSFPQHPQAGQALATIGQVHQVNEAWEDAIAAYQRVMDEYPAGPWVLEARWSIAECRINLSQWREAEDAYREYAAAYGQDARAQEAARRQGVAKDLARYQVLVDEKGQRKAFDAQFQIAQIIRTQLANPPKAIIEYRKVAANWPESHLADDALLEVGSIHLSMEETAKGREALLHLATKYPDSPLADDALYQVGQSYEAEAERLAGVTKGRAVEKSRDIAQREAYQQVQEGRRNFRASNELLVAELKRQGQQKDAEVAQARHAAQLMQYNLANTTVAAQAAEQQVESLTAAQLADRQDKISAALRKAVEAYQRAAKVPAADKADEALLLMARIYDEKLKDSDAAMTAWQEIVRQFSGTDVAEDASWRIAQFHERKRQYPQAVEAYQAFLRNYRASARAADAQFAIAEDYEHLGEWVKAMDAYTNYINSFPNAPKVAKAREQITWIKTYRL